MKHAMATSIIVLLLAAPTLAAGPVIDLDNMAWDRYYDQDEVTAVLQALHAKHPRLTDLRSLGKSEEGRDVWLLTINDPQTGPHDAKPGIYVDGAIHGNEIQATEVCLYLARLLLERHDEWSRLGELLSRTAFYIVPTVNVDNRARFFEGPSGYNIGRSARVPHDDDGDGLLDEDDYDDLDGDGQILQMRIRDPHGTHRTHPDDPRVVVRVKPGEQAEWRLLGLEGLDNDGDGRINEDVPGYLDMNRNWGFMWQPGYVEAGSGDYPFSARNTRAVSDFLAGRTNICFGFNFHNYGGMWLRGPGSDMSPPMPTGDVKVYDFLGAEGERVVPGYRYLISSQDLYATHGDFDEWMYQCLGVYCFVGELYMSSQTAYRGRADEPNGEDDTLWSRRAPLVERQKFNDALMMGEMFQEWKPFTHPTYGEIEIGGWRTFTTRMPPPFLMPEMLHRNAMYVLWTAGEAPRVSVEITETRDLGDGLWRVRARAVNAGAIPTLSGKARGKAILPLDEFRIAGDGIEVLSGGVLLDRWFDTVAAVERRPERIPTWTDGFGVREVQWFVRGKGEVTVEYVGKKSRDKAVTAKLSSE
ncbi:hypothetical protein KKA85_15615 [bacterium]|nr:hypothetical protein [bacterium]